MSADIEDFVSALCIDIDAEAKKERLLAGAAAEKERRRDVYLTRRHGAHRRRRAQALTRRRAWTLQRVRKLQDRGRQVAYWASVKAAKRKGRSVS